LRITPKEMGGKYGAAVTPPLSEQTYFSTVAFAEP
jgi:hypothetical protein